MMRKYWFFLPVVFLLLALSACSFNLAGDVTPPPGWRPTPVPPTPDMSAFYPALPPDPAAGKEIFQQNCQECHGESALGDGPEAAKLPSPPAALASLEELREATPAERFLTVTHGKPDHGMPPFASTLTARQRWDVLAYIYTLGIDDNIRERGALLYGQRCVSCHEENGAGKNLVSQQRLAQKSDETLFDAILGPQHMQTQTSQQAVQSLSEDDRWALVAYIRSLSFAQPAGEEDETTATPAAGAAAETTPTAEATPEATPAHGALTVTGQVTNGTAGGQVPEGLEITLHGYDDMQENYTATTKADAEGKFVFENVPNAPNRLFRLTTEYKNVSYASQVVLPPSDDNAVDLPLTIYDTTTDRSALQVDRLHVFVVLQNAQTLRITEVYVITNNSDKTVVGESADAPVLEFELPVKASHLEFPDEEDVGNRYVEVTGGFGDLMPVPPQHTTQEVFAYYLPFQDKERLVSHPVPLPVSGVVVVVPTESRLTVEGEHLMDNGVQSDNQGNTYHIYNGDALQAGELLAYTVKRASSGLSLQGNSKISIAIGLMAMGAALIAMAVVFTKRETASAGGGDAPVAEYADVEDDPDILMDAMLALDDLYKAGKIAESAYKARRAVLKDRLKALLTEDEQA